MELKYRECRISFHELLDAPGWDLKELINGKLEQAGIKKSEGIVEHFADMNNEQMVYRQYYKENPELIEPNCTCGDHTSRFEQDHGCCEWCHFIGGEE